MVQRYTICYVLRISYTNVEEQKYTGVLIFVWSIIRVEMSVYGYSLVGWVEPSHFFKGLDCGVQPLFILAKFFERSLCVELRQKLLEHIKKSGLKKSYVADKIGISPSKLSNYLHGKLIVTNEFEQNIRNYLERQN